MRSPLDLPERYNYLSAFYTLMLGIFTKKRESKGFTLIELLVVIAIIGVLASIVLASLNNARRKSRDARRITDVKQIQLALELSFDSNQEYPDAVSELVTGNFIPSEPKDPTSQASYAYVNLNSSAGTACDASTTAGTCLYYQLGAVLEDTANPALDQDADKDLSAAGGLDGNDANCDTTAGAGTDACYDVTP